MKKPFMVDLRRRDAGLAGRLFVQLRYDDKSGQTIVTQGKPQLDKEPGMTSYIDESGNKPPD